MVQAATGGLAMLDVKYIAIRAKCKVTVAHTAARGDAGVESVASSGHVDWIED